MTAEMKKYLGSEVNTYINTISGWQSCYGRLKGEELAQYNSWLDYLDALELVDTSCAPDIEWPTPRQFRPDDIRRCAGIVAVTASM
ncbi:hypothetical protein PA45B_3680 [Escherichia coli]|nr:hypothetical protein PA45B_3680 [Escherichia coli]